MSGVHYQITVDDRQINAALDRLIALGQHPREAMQDIATIGENSTRDRFTTGTDPDGNAWKPSHRVMEKGGKTLIKSGRLLSSLTRDSGDDFAQWGSNAIYAAIHQAGGKAGRGHKVEIPARPYLGINSDDEASIVDIINQHLAEAVTG